MNSYLPPHGPTPPMEEVTVPRPKVAHEIVDRWGPFNRGESSTDHVHNLYPMMMRIPVTVRVRGRGEEYNISVPCSTSKEDLQQMIEDGMQFCNRNFDQSTKLVSLEALVLVLALISNHCHLTSLLLHRRLLLSGTWPSSTKNFEPS